MRLKFKSACACVSLGAVLGGASVSQVSAQVSQETIAPPAEPAPAAKPAPAAEPAPAIPPTEPAAAKPTPAPTSAAPPAAPTKKIDLEEDASVEAKTPASAPPQKAASSKKSTSPPAATKETSSPKKAATPPAPPLPPPVDYAALPWTYHQKRIDVGVGLRLHWVTDADYELFSDSKLLPLLNVRAGGTVWTRDRLSLAALGEWDYGASSGQARGVPTQMHMHRFQLGGEVRYHVAPWLAPYGRLSLGLARFASRIGEENAFTTLHQAGYQFVGALNAGVALRLLGSPDGRKRSPRLHLLAEAGYAFASNVTLDYEVSEEGPLRPEGVDLGSLSMSGPQMTLGLLGSF